MADQLTPAQKEAVYNQGGKLLVSAAAGSGKTKVLVDRLLRYLTDEKNPANVDDFLMITYTKAAASELRMKIAEKLSERIAAEPDNRHLQKQMQRLYLTKISTVHGFCGDMLHQYAYRLDLSADFRVADETECQELRQELMAELLENAYTNLGDDPDFCSVTDNQGYGRDDRKLPELIGQVYDASRCHADPEGWLNQCLAHAETADVTDAAQTVWGKWVLDDIHKTARTEWELLNGCRDRLLKMEGSEKAIVHLDSILSQLMQLEQTDSWDSIHAMEKIDFGRLPTLRKPADPVLWEQVKAVRDLSKERLGKAMEIFSMDSARILGDLLQSASAQRGLIALVRQFGEDYSKKKSMEHVLDFSDLEHKSLDLLLGANRSAPTAAAREIGAGFREIMVDEYQDSNRVQDAIFEALTKDRQNCFLVGDVKQSIYQFRLADPTIFLEKYSQWPDAQDARPGNGRRVLLSHNFRSGPEVVEAVNAVFSLTMSPESGGLYYTEAEALREGVPHERFAEPAVELLCIESEEDAYGAEAAIAAQRIRTMLDEGTLIRTKEGLRPVQPEDIAILLRSPGSIGGHYVRALRALGIPCSSGAGDSLLKTRELSFLRSLLQVISNPRQDIPLVAVLASPVFSVTADDLAKLRSGHKKCSMYDAVLASSDPKILHFRDVLAQLRDAARFDSLVGLLQKCYVLTDADCIFGAMADGQLRQKNLHSFYRLAADYESGGLRTLEQFLEHLDAVEEKGTFTGEASGGVTLMSIHKSKGLEFPVVLLCGLSRKFNTESLNAQILCDQELGLGLSAIHQGMRVRYPTVARKAIADKKKREMVSEELRVLYVAMTRARDRLIMTYAAKSLEKTVSALCARLALESPGAISRDAACPGIWVLMAALLRTEAGQLRALGGSTVEGAVSEIPWSIRVMQPIRTEEERQAEPEEEAPEMTVDAGVLEKSLSFRYPFAEATRAPSKQTATGRRDRSRYEEAAEQTPSQPRPFAPREPGFVSQRKSAVAYGNAMHAAMQYIRYDACGDRQEVQTEIQRLCHEGFLSEEQAAMVNCSQIADFFQTDVGWLLRSGAESLREFKFSILEDAADYGDNLAGEQVLLQGVVDCAVINTDGITLVDFKTDRVTPETVGEAAERYRVQLETYAGALERIFEKKVTRKLLYFFRLGSLTEL